MNSSHLINRRNLLKMAGAGLGALSFPILSAAKSDDGLIELRATKTTHKLASKNEAASDLWLYNGTSPGPEIRAVQGETVRVRFTNELDEPTSIHWHGIRITNAMDGVSGLTQEPVKPGDTFEYVFDVPDAGTFWYHAHNKSWKQVARGLYGPLIVDEPVPLLDRTHDLTLVIDDWRLDNDGSLDLASFGSLGDWSHAGRLGNWLTVNGTSQPTFKLNKGETYRIRLINAANARILQVDPSVIGAKVIGYDGFLFDKPRDADGETLAITPAQRVDLLLTPDDASLRRLNDIGDFALQELSGRKALSIALFDVVEPGTTNQKSKVVLQPNKIAEPDLSLVKDVSLIMEGGAMGRMGNMMHQGRMMERSDIARTGQMWAFNGIANLGDEPLFRAKVGETIVLTTDNQTGWPHGIHLHGYHFQVIEHNGKTPTHIDWRDTFTIKRDETVKIAFVAENPGQWLLHCHMLEHAAAGMNTWFEIV